MRKMIFVAMMALLVLGAVIAVAETPTKLMGQSSTVYDVRPMGVCNYYCSYCVIYGHGGACSSSRVCC